MAKWTSIHIVTSLTDIKSIDMQRRVLERDSSSLFVNVKELLSSVSHYEFRPITLTCLCSYNRQKCTKRRQKHRCFQSFWLFLRLHCIFKSNKCRILIIEHRQWRIATIARRTHVGQRLARCHRVGNAVVDVRSRLRACIQLHNKHTNVVFGSASDCHVT